MIKPIFIKTTSNSKTFGEIFFLKLLFTDFMKDLKILGRTENNKLWVHFLV